MRKTFTELSLLHLAQNPLSIDFHLNYWKEVLNNYPQNKHDLSEVMISKLFDWKENSNFLISHRVNPLTLAIAESDKLIDIVYFSENPNINEASAIDALKRIFYFYLTTKETNEFRNIHPFFHNIVFDPSFTIKHVSDILYSSLEDIKLNSGFFKSIMNAMTLYFDILLYTHHDNHFKPIKINGLNFWKIIGLGFKISVDKLYEAIIKPGFVLLEDRIMFNDVIVEFSQTGILPERITKKINDSDGLDLITQFLNEIKKEPHVVLLLAL